MDADRSDGYVFLAIPYGLDLFNRIGSARIR